ncbi:MAG: class I tRNA ligase family protein, partial [Candidatus Levybacteria bacterium]|nr:class I tRNA ligase family protein [Candidatus Levybacteria bacterium]
MDKIYNHKDVEDKIYKNWEESGYFQPEVHPDGKPYCIILPPPNANGDLHFGHAMFTVEDILIRYHRMKGYASLWLPGTDHAGIETQFVFEKKLRNEGKSRLDYSREELYKMIDEFVNLSKGKIQNQLRKLGFSLDWSREKYTLDPDIVQLVYKTFRQMYEDGLIYRAKRLVNYCTKDGTSFSDLEVVYEERKDPLYYIKYGPLVLATTRPETKFGDTAVAVHPNDKRYKQYVGQEIEIETVLGKARIKVIADESVDPLKGTGILMVCTYGDKYDVEAVNRRKLAPRIVFTRDGKMNALAGKYEGLDIKTARKDILADLEKARMLVTKKPIHHTVNVHERCGTEIEFLSTKQWFVHILE